MPLSESTPPAATLSVAPLASVAPPATAAVPARLKLPLVTLPLSESTPPEATEIAAEPLVSVAPRATAAVPESVNAPLVTLPPSESVPCTLKVPPRTLPPLTAKSASAARVTLPLAESDAPLATVAVQPRLKAPVVMLPPSLSTA